MVGRAHDQVERALRASYSTRARSFATLFFSGLIFLAFAFTTDIPWHLQTLQGGVQYWDEALLNSITGLYLGGAGTVVLVAVYSVLGGAALTNIGIRLANYRVAAREMGAILPGFVATGCASCGIGLLGILGFTGSAAFLPFGGDLFKFGGILLILYALHEFGDPETCSV